MFHVDMYTCAPRAKAPAQKCYTRDFLFTSGEWPDALTQDVLQKLVRCSVSSEDNTRS